MTQLFIAEQGSESMVQTHAYSRAISVCRIAWAGFAIVAITQPPINGISSVRASLTFACFYRRLNLAAKLLQLQVVPS